MRIDIDTTDLSLGDSTQLARSGDLASRCTCDDIGRFGDHAARGEPVADFLRDDLDDGDPRIVLVAFVDAVAQVAKPGGCPAHVTRVRYGVCACQEVRTESSSASQ